MHEVIKNHVQKGDRVIAILDPPRAGVHNSVIRSIRNCKEIDHVIFVACSLKASMQNLVDLCRPTNNKFGGFPFMPSRALSVDMFPHTEHFEVLVQFIRQTADQNFPVLLKNDI
jgi:tRNA (uracil-5-)-methyltransferase